MSDSSTGDLPDLLKDEVVVDDPEERIWRQVHPKNTTDTGAPSSAAFVPNDVDEGCLSCSRESKVTAKRAFLYHTEILELESAGTWSVPVAEISRVDLRCVDDSATATDEAPLPPGHVYIDYRTLGGKAVRRKARLIAHAATAAYLHPAG